MYTTYGFLQSCIVNWGWHLENMKSIATCMRFKQKVNDLSFILWQKGSNHSFAQFWKKPLNFQCFWKSFGNMFLSKRFGKDKSLEKSWKSALFLCEVVCCGSLSQ